MSGFRQVFYRCMLALLACAWMPPVFASGWSVTELHVQYGNLDVPKFEGGGHAYHLIYTLQRANGWKYGDNFFFINVLDSRSSGFQDFDLYAEWYSNLSLGRITGRELAAGVISDFGFILGLNWVRDAKVRKFLPGIRLALDIKGFSFANLDIMAYIDDSRGVSSGGAPKEHDAFIVDFNFARPFRVGGSSFSIEGHVEYVGERKNEFGDRVAEWVLAQPQFRWNPSDRLSLGIEYQYWMNKLGDRDTDENTLQALLVWKF